MNQPINQSEGGRITQDRRGMNVIFVHSALDDANLSVHAFRIYCHLARRANTMGMAYPGAESMGKVCGMSKTTVKQAVKELEDRQMMKVKRSEGGRQTNLYMLTAPAEWTDSPGRHTTRSGENLFEYNKRDQRVTQDDKDDPVATRPGQEATRSGGDPVAGRSAPGQEATGTRSPDDRKGDPERTSNKKHPEEETIFDAWNELAEEKGLAKIREITPQRRKKINTRMNEENGFNLLIQAISNIRANAWLCGANQRSWKVSFDWLFDSRANLVKASEEGRYSQGSKSEGPGGEATVSTLEEKF